MCAMVTQPTKDTIVTDAMKLAGYPNGGSATQLTNGGIWIEEAKMDIQNMANKYNVQLSPLLVTSYGVTTDAISRYANPSDCSKIYSVSILKGDHEGTSTASTSSQVTLAADEDISAGDAEGRILLLTSGTYVGNASQISDLTGVVATVTPDFNNASVTGASNYMIVDTHTVLEKSNPAVYDDISNPAFSAEPTMWFPQGQGNADDDETGEFELYPVPDDVYGLKIRYYLNLTLLDLTTDANLLQTLYRRWYPMLLRKVLYRQLKVDRDEERGALEESSYFQLLDEYILNEKSKEQRETVPTTYY